MPTVVKFGDSAMILHSLIGPDRVARTSLASSATNGAICIGTVEASDLRRAKRLAIDAQRWYGVETRDLIATIVAAADRFLADSEKLNIWSILIGRNREELSSELAERRRWMRGVSSFLLGIFPQGYPVAPKDAAAIYYRAKGPVLLILPRNSDEEGFYLLLHIILARTGAIIKAPSGGARSFIAVELLDALRASAVSEPVARALDTISVVNLPESIKKQEIPDCLAVDRAIWIVFGTETTVAEVTAAAARFQPQAILGYGTGLASAILSSSAGATVLDDVIAGAQFRGGAECTCTKLLYVHASRLQSTMSRLHAEKKLKATLLQPDSRWLEQPGEVLGVRPFTSVEELLRLYAADLAANGLTRNVAASVFTEDREEYLRLLEVLPAYSVRWNRSAHEAALGVAHNGREWMRDLVLSQVCDL